MVAHASIWLLDTGGIPAAVAAGAEGMVTLGGILGVLVVVAVACLFAIGYREWRSECARSAGSASAPLPRRTILQGSRRDGTVASSLPGLAGVR